MLLGRFRIRGKLALLASIPLVAMVALAVPVVSARIGQANRASAMARAVQVADGVGTLVQDLQRERLMSVGFLIGAVDRTALTLQISDGTDRVADTRAELGEILPDRVSAALDEISDLNDVRTSVFATRMSPEQVMTEYSAVITSVLESLRLIDGLDTSTSEGQQVVALESLFAADEATTLESTALVVLAYDHSSTSLALVNTSHVTATNALKQVTAMATDSQLALRDLVDQAFASRVGDTSTDALGSISGVEPLTLYSQMDSFITLGDFVEKRIVADISDSVQSRRTSALLTAYGVGAMTLLVLGVVLVLLFLVASAVAQPLIELTASAERVAALAENELERVADDESESVEPIRLEDIDTSGRDEIGGLARAFERVQHTAARLVERQVHSRRNVAEMFGHVGRRTHNLVSRQVAIIDALEHEETNSDRLRELYSLDHLSNRLRRNANSLVVLSGATREDEHLAPVPLADAARLALAEIEDYQRVDVRIAQDIVLIPSAVTDLVLVIAELMENATMFSPPHTRVTVTAQHVPTGARLIITDQGIGMTPERIAEENGRLTRRERLDLVPTQVLGLFVVGRLSRRHNMRVTLSPTPDGGVTVVVDLGRNLLLGAAEPEIPEIVAAPPTAGDSRDSSGTLSALQRADRLLASTPSWNAFAIAARPVLGASADRAVGQASVLGSSPVPAQAVAGEAPAAPPAPTPTLPGTGFSPAASVAPVAQEAPSRSTSPAPRSEAQVSPSGLRRRVPGANLMGETVSARHAAVPEESDADEARSLAELFEAGVQRAKQEADSAPPELSAPADTYQPAETPPRPEPSPAPPPPKPTNLRRRVPGATLSSSLPPLPGRKPAIAEETPDPEVARELIEQFESGVLRALSDAGTSQKRSEV